MDRKKPFLRIGLISVVVIAIALVWTLEMSRQRPRPNVLLITIDTLRADHVGAYGAKGAATPVLDRLAASGVLVPRAFTAVPVTLASHATVLTGLYPPHHGVRGNSFYRLTDAVPTLAILLKSFGYETAAVVGAAVLDHRFGLDRGFDSYDDQISGRGDTLIAERPASDVVSRAIAWLDDPGHRAPFFIWVHLFDPHHPYEPPEPFRSRFASAPYDGEIAFADQQIGRLLDHLGATRLKNTIVIVASDHGESLGEHGEQTHGVLLYDATLRVPLIIAGPGVDRHSGAAANPASLVDIVPTVLALIGSPPLAAIDGRNLLGDGSHPRSLYAETRLPLDFYNWSPLRSIRAGGLKLIDAPDPELYDVERDPGETHDLARAEPLRVRQMGADLSRLFTTAAASAQPAVGTDLADRLRSLGYVAGSTPGPDPAAAGRRPAPKSRLPLVAVLDRALSLVSAGHRAEAVAVLRDVLLQDPGNYLAARTLGDALFDIGRNEEAISAYERALANGRDAGYYHYRLALLHERQGHYSDAAREFARLVRMNPEAAAEITERGDRLAARGRAADAAGYFQAAALADHSPGVLMRLADAQLKSGQAGDAVDSLEHALAANPSDASVRDLLVTALNAVGAARGSAGDYEGAVQAFQRAQMLAPADFESLANGGLAQLRAGHPGPALETLTRALALRPTEVRLLNPVAELHYRRGDLRQARELLARSLAVDPRQPRIRAALRDVERRLGGGASLSPARPAPQRPRQSLNDILLPAPALTVTKSHSHT